MKGQFKFQAWAKDAESDGFLVIYAFSDQAEFDFPTILGSPGPDSDRAQASELPVSIFSHRGQCLEA
jgi:hypothetical protein